MTHRTPHLGTQHGFNFLGDSGGASLIGKKIFVLSGEHHLLSFAVLLLWHLLNYCLSAPNPNSCMWLCDSVAAILQIPLLPCQWVHC